MAKLEEVDKQLGEVQACMWSALYDQYMDADSKYKQAIRTGDEKDAKRELERITQMMGVFHKDLSNYELKHFEVTANMMVEDKKRESNLKLEEEKRKTSVEIEKERKRVSVGCRIWEVAKILLPIVAGSITYGIAQKRLLKFEEEGHITTSAGKDLHLPKP